MEAQRLAAILLLSFSALMALTSASFNVTYSTTTVSLTNSTTAHVVETLDVYISNASVSLYNQDRGAINLTLSKWQRVIGSDLLTEHILNPKASISNFTFLPGPLNPAGYAVLTMSYEAQNVTSVKAIAPRQFEYTFNSTVFNFQHTASGQSLFPNSKLVLQIPNTSKMVDLYPAPDYPIPNAYGQFTNSTFVWNQAEPLQRFIFIYIVYQTPQQEVLAYFTNAYNSNKQLIYLIAILAIVVLLLYVYIKVFE